MAGKVRGKGVRGPFLGALGAGRRCSRPLSREAADVAWGQADRAHAQPAQLARDEQTSAWLWGCPFRRQTLQLEAASRADRSEIAIERREHALPRVGHRRRGAASGHRGRSRVILHLDALADVGYPQVVGRGGRSGDGSAAYRPDGRLIVGVRGRIDCVPGSMVKRQTRSRRRKSMSLRSDDPHRAHPRAPVLLEDAQVASSITSSAGGRCGSSRGSTAARRSSRWRLPPSAEPDVAGVARPIDRHSRPT